ncbi:hypothetical protein EJB05_55020, partial [Eragrostis curvula]
MAGSKLKKSSATVIPLSVDDSTMMKPTPPPSPLSVAKLAAKKIPLLPLFISVKVACTLALIIAVVLAACAADELINSPCDPVDHLNFERLQLIRQATSSRSRWCIELTDAAGAKVEALERGQLWVSGIQAVAALLGLLLFGRCSLVVAFIALTVGAANLCMGAVVDAIFITAAP